MILKIINSFVIIIFSTLTGFEIAKKYVLRTRELSALQAALSRLETEIMHYSSLLPEAMLRIGGSMEGGAGKLFKETGIMLSQKQNITVSKAWTSSLDLLKQELCLKKEDLDILQRFGEQLGSSDREGQANFIRLTVMQLKEEEQRAKEIREKYERMYKSLGLLGGLALAILLF